jgi:hypothetical protein
MNKLAAKDATGHWFLMNGNYGRPGPGLIPGIGEIRGLDWWTILPNALAGQSEVGQSKEGGRKTRL